MKLGKVMLLYKRSTVVQNTTKLTETVDELSATDRRELLYFGVPCSFWAHTALENSRRIPSGGVKYTGNVKNAEFSALETVYKKWTFIMITIGNYRHRIRSIHGSRWNDLEWSWEAEYESRPTHFPVYMYARTVDLERPNLASRRGSILTGGKGFRGIVGMSLSLDGSESDQGEISHSVVRYIEQIRLALSNS